MEENELRGNGRKGEGPITSNYGGIREQKRDQGFQERGQ